MILPYRAKNQPEHFPGVTLALIALNTLIFAVTSHTLLVVRQDVVENFAVSHQTLSLWRLCTAMFLHGNFLHLLGNMWFLWIFGAPLEGRLRPAKFLIVYLCAGLLGGLLDETVTGIVAPARFTLGASGAIMGIAGAYLYVFPYSVICILYRITWFYGGTAEWQARWVVLGYIGFDVVSMLLFRGGDGVAHLAHIGGFGIGLLAVFVLRVRRDSEEVSVVQAVRADVKNYTLLSLDDLEILLEHYDEDMNLVFAYLEKVVMTYNTGRYTRCLSLVNRHGSRLLLQDPCYLAQLLLRIQPAVSALPTIFYLRLASRLESLCANDLAAPIYRLIYDVAPTGPDTEAALYRLGQLMYRVYCNPADAAWYYQEMLRLFPRGNLTLEAQRALRQQT